MPQPLNSILHCQQSALAPWRRARTCITLRSLHGQEKKNVVRNWLFELAMHSPCYTTETYKLAAMRRGLRFRKDNNKNKVPSSCTTAARCLQLDPFLIRKLNIDSKHRRPIISFEECVFHRPLMITLHRNFNIALSLLSPYLTPSSLDSFSESAFPSEMPEMPIPSPPRPEVPSPFPPSINPDPTPEIIPPANPERPYPLPPLEVPPPSEAPIPTIQPDPPPEIIPPPNPETPYPLPPLEVPPPSEAPTVQPDPPPEIVPHPNPEIPSPLPPLEVPPPQPTQVPFPNPKPRSNLLDLISNHATKTTAYVKDSSYYNSYYRAKALTNSTTE